LKYIVEWNKEFTNYMYIVLTETDFQYHFKIILILLEFSGKYIILYVVEKILLNRHLLIIQNLHIQNFKKK